MLEWSKQRLWNERQAEDHRMVILDGGKENRQGEKKNKKRAEIESEMGRGGDTD